MIKERKNIMTKKKFKLMNNSDGNDAVDLISNTLTDALWESLDVLGWNMVEEEVEEEE